MVKKKQANLLTQFLQLYFLWEVTFPPKASLFVCFVLGAKFDPREVIVHENNRDNNLDISAWMWILALICMKWITIIGDNGVAESKAIFLVILKVFTINGDSKVDF